MRLTITWTSSWSCAQECGGCSMSLTWAWPSHDNKGKGDMISKMIGKMRRVRIWGWFCYNYCLLSIVSLWRGGTRRAAKKSVRLPAKRKGMGPRSGRQSWQWIRFHLIIVGESKSVQVGPLSSSFLCACDWGNSLVIECIASWLSSWFAAASQWAQPRLWLKRASVPIVNAMSGWLPNASQDNALTNSLYSFPAILSFSSWVARQSPAERNEPTVRGIEMGAVSTMRMCQWASNKEMLVSEQQISEWCISLQSQCQLTIEWLTWIHSNSHPILGNCWCHQRERVVVAESKFELSQILPPLPWLDASKIQAKKYNKFQIVWAL